MNIKRKFYNIPVSSRVIAIYSIILFITGASLLARPNAELNLRVSAIIGLQPDFIAFVLWAMIPLMLSLHALMSSIFAVIVPMTPLYSYIFIVSLDINSSGGSLFHLAMSLSTVILTLAIYYFALEYDEALDVIQILKLTLKANGN